MNTMKKSDSNLKLFKLVHYAIGRWLLVSIMGGLLLPAARSAPLPADPAPEMVTNLAELSRLAKGNRSLIIPLKIEAKAA
jgi:hypothetical protein